MIILENPNGIIDVSNEYFSILIGNAVSSCYGVAGMAPGNAVQGIAAFFGRKKIDHGVLVASNGHQLAIELHIIVMYGVNINEIVKSIIKKVRYTIEEATGLAVESVNVFVDGMKSE
ncbi:MAG TPA: Asp23/Gls24 family envelope stress response protein [Ruminococcaceae bacterium]|nr:Asp23/Gls24 family envelope stress response protein [Oscillospiraceae bacterium]